jgi:hypothetical protein
MYVLINWRVLGSCSLHVHVQAPFIAAADQLPPSWIVRYCRLGKARVSCERLAGCRGPVSAKTPQLHAAVNGAAGELPAVGTECDGPNNGSMMKQSAGAGRCAFVARQAP